MKTSENTILITGGGSGIGRELARRFNELGNTVIVAGRHQETLEETIADRQDMHAMVVDIEDPEAIMAFVDRVVVEHPSLNVLINNAGIMRREDLSRPRDLSDSEQTVITNLLGPIRLTNALTDHLVNQPDAAIVNVTSGLAFVPMSGTPTYNATKAALHSYTVSLREQLKGKVELIELAPPAVQTELTPGQSTREGYMPLADFIDEVMMLFREQPTPREILVERVNFLRWAERDGHFDHAVEMLSALSAGTSRHETTGQVEESHS
ncbi:SDR family oxidoreductase [Halomonas cupida]|uniref:SDR family oxidoreductase n=1 Tax=Halomonas cupida TaxID=44933 RepID=UPI000937EE0D|nr:SDR family oxidoreductase [Halomonas cupida]